MTALTLPTLSRAATLLRLRAELERKFESELRAQTDHGSAGAIGADDVVDALDVVASGEGPSV